MINSIFTRIPFTNRRKRKIESQLLNIMPCEILYYIFQYLVNDLKTCMNLCLTCKSFYYLLQEIWSCKYKTWRFDLIPRSPNMIKKNYAIIDKVEYDKITSIQRFLNNMGKNLIDVSVIELNRIEYNLINK